jgi:RNA polymerase sigma factor (sigma-70 family)
VANTTDLPSPAQASVPAEAVTALYQAHALGLISEEHRQVLTAMRRLPSRQREVLVLRFYLDLDEEETAASMRISRGTVKSTTSRALAALGRILGEQQS